MITIDQYVGEWKNSPDWTQERCDNAWKMLLAVNGLMTIALPSAVVFRINPKTNSQVSGETYGGFRPQSCPIGAPKSSHKEGLAVDIYDPDGAIDAWCMANQDVLKANGIYIEHPDSTPGWSHWTIRAPGSGHTVFYP